MPPGRAQFIGNAGQYYVAYGLAVRQINVSIATGNVPSVDLLAASADGKCTLALQVKTSRNAYRRNRYGHEGYEWDVGAAVIGNRAPSFWYALVNLQEEANDHWTPQVFFVPSRWVATFVQPNWRRLLYFLPKAVQEYTLERWDLVKKYLAGNDTDVQSVWDQAKPSLVSWGD